MAIQTRRGNEADFDASKMLPGEWAVSLDTRYVRMCFSPGIVLRMATYEGFESEKAQIQAILAECKTIQSAVQRIQAEVNSKASLVVEYSDSAKKSADRAYSEAERAKTYANNAEAVTGVNIATQDRAGLVKGGDNYIAEDGTLMLITSTTETTMPNSHSGRLKVDEIVGGESQQNSTAGNQLFDGMLEQGSYNGTTGKFDSTTRVRSANNMSVSPNETYTFSCEGAEYVAIIELDESGSNASTLSSFASLPLTFTTSSNGYFIVLALKIDDVTAITPSMVNNVMLNKGTTALPWEPYTGGIASPSPSYPQEIKKTVVSEIRTHGTQFFNDSTKIEGAGLQTDTGKVNQNNPSWVTSEYIVINELTNYCISQSTDAYFQYNLCFYDYQKNFVSSLKVGKSGIKKYAFVTPEKATYMRFAYSIQVSGNAVDRGNIMLNQGTEALSYEPYTESAIALSQPIELYGISDMEDTIERDRVVRKFRKLECNGDENWKTSSSVPGRYYLENMDSEDYARVMCSHTKGVLTTSTTPNECYFSTATNVRGRFLVNTEFATVDEWKTHLVNNPMTVVYERAVELVEPLPIVDQIALNSLKTFNGITYLEFDSEIEPTFKGEYGTSKVGGYTLEGMLAGRNGELYGSRIEALEATVVNNI